jgi:NAD-dependent dihydropyrimidine dehydrogenase PreA subunit
MKAVLCYYSGTGNTELACRHVAGRLGAGLELFDVLAGGDLPAGEFDAFGFASPTDFWGLPSAFEAFIERLPRQEGKPAFVFNTYGALSGQTLRILGEAVSARGFEVVAGHSLRMPENYPPMIARGMGARGAPSAKGLRAFDAFVSEAARRLEAGRRGGVGLPRIGFLNGIIPRTPRTKARDDMGEKFVDASSCTECGLCARSCPYGAIRLDPKPVFDMDSCRGCWRCYNLCPSRSIRTAKFRGEPHYRGPDAALRERLGTQPPAGLASSPGS